MEANATGPALVVTASAPGAGAAGDAPALAELAVLALQAVGERAHAVPPPPACRPPSAVDAPQCSDAIKADLRRGGLHVALVTVPAAAAPHSHYLHDLGLDELGDVAPSARRRCVSPAPALSLLDLSNENLAHSYFISHEDLANALNKTLMSLEYSKNVLQPDWCISLEAKCATILTSDIGEASALMDVVRTNKLYARVHPLGSALPTAAAALGSRALVCDWNAQLANRSALALHTLGPPPCDAFSDIERCPFESRRFMKLVNYRALAHSHAALLALLQLRIKSNELYELTQLAKVHDSKTAAVEFLKLHPLKSLISEVRVAVLLPATTPREAYDGTSLAAAAALAEADLEKDWSGIRFKVNNITKQQHIFTVHNLFTITNVYKIIREVVITKGKGRLLN